MGVHDGHRQRMKSRFLEAGLDGFNDHNALEMLLFYALPRKDTNELAHKLLNHFGSLAAVLEADQKALSEIEGIGENASVLLKLIPAISRRYMEEVMAPRKSVESAEQLGRYFIAKFMYFQDEVCYALLLDNANRVITCKQISKGVVNATEVGVRTLIELAMKYRASGVIIAHNHPNGMPEPSREDEDCTVTVQNMLNVVGVKLIDHIIVGGGVYYSFKQCGVM